MEVRKRQISSKKTIPIKMIVIGDSRAKAGYVPDLVSYETLNLALGGSTIVEGYFTLLTYLKNNPPPENVVLSYSPYYLMKNSYFWERTVKYDSLQIDQYKSILKYSKIKNESGIGTLDQTWKYKHLTSMYISSAITGLIKKRWKENAKFYKGLKESSGHAYFGVKNGSASLNTESKQLDKFYRSDLIHFYFIKMIQLAKSYNVKLHWYTIPFNNASCIKLANDFVSSFDSYIDSIKDMSDINIIKKTHCLDNKCFGDGSHVFQGSNLTTQDIMKAIN